MCPFDSLAADGSRAVVSLPPLFLIRIARLYRDQGSDGDGCSLRSLATSPTVLLKSTRPYEIRECDGEVRWCNGVS